MHFVKQGGALSSHLDSENVRFDISFEAVQGTKLNDGCEAFEP